MNPNTAVIQPTDSSAGSVATGAHDPAFRWAKNATHIREFVEIYAQLAKEEKNIWAQYHTDWLLIHAERFIECCESKIEGRTV